MIYIKKDDIYYNFPKCCRDFDNTNYVLDFSISNYWIFVYLDSVGIHTTTNNNNLVVIEKII